jgi:predicted nuclease of predicted toxin-antitoxin system
VVQVYLDEDVSVLLGELLKSRNIDAITARDIGMLGKTDDEHLRQAMSLKRIFITHNRVDFEQLFTDFVFQNTHHFRIIVLTRKRDVYTSAQRLVKFLSQNKNINDQLWYL